MDAALGLERPVGVLALHRHRRGLEASLLARARLHEVGGEAAVVGPAQVHAEQHLRPVLRVGAAGARVDGEHRVAAVVLACEERVLLEPLELARDRTQLDRKLLLQRRVQLVELGRVLDLRPQPLVAIESPLHACVLGRDLRRPGLVVPEPWIVHRRLELAEAGGQRVGVKGNHGPTRGGP